MLEIQERGFSQQTFSLQRRLDELQQAADHGEIGVVVADGTVYVEPGDGRPVLGRKPEVEHVDILGHALGPHRLRDDDDPLIDQIAQRHLAHALAVLRTDLGQQRVVYNTYRCILTSAVLII